MSIFRITLVFTVSEKAQLFDAVFKITRASDPNVTFEVDVRKMDPDGRKIPVFVTAQSQEDYLEVLAKLKETRVKPDSLEGREVRLFTDVAVVDSPMARKPKE